MTNTLTTIKSLAKGHAVKGPVTGRIAAIKRPYDVTEHDRLRNRHRQDIEIADESGETLWVQLEKERQHLTPDNKGRYVVLESVNGDNGMVGLTLDRWEKRGGGSMTTLIASGAASIYFADPPEGQAPKPSAGHAPPPAGEASPPAPHRGILADHVAVMEACYTSIGCTEDDKQRQAMASTVFIELGRKGLVKKVADALSGSCDAAQSAKPSPGADAPASAPQGGEVTGGPVTGIVDAEIIETGATSTPPGGFVTQYAELASGLHGRFAQEVIDRAFHQIRELLGVGDEGAREAIVLDEANFISVCESAEEQLRDEDLIPF